MQRLLELETAKRNEKWMKEQGGYEIGKEHYPIVIGIHVLFFLGILVEVFFLRATPPSWWYVPFTIFLISQGFRYWCIKSLGKYWSTRIIVVPEHKISVKGPYRYLRHPNYLVVMVEIFVFPIIFGAYITSISLSIVNTFILLLLRIPLEELALEEATKYQEKMVGKKRFFPTWK
jgi:methyltransferase